MKTNVLLTKILLSVAFAVTCSMISSKLLAQVKIGDNPTVINPGSVLELETTDKGLLMPRVALTNTTTWGLAGTPAAGMHVYNTSNTIASTNVNYPTLAAFTGEYYWDGTGWVALAQQGVQDASVQLSIKKSAANQYLPIGVHSVVNFTGEDFDKGNDFDLATDAATIPSNGTGYYQVNGNFTSVVQAAGQGAYLYVWVNAVLRKLVAVGNSVGGGIAAGGSCTIQLVAGDIVTFRMVPSSNNVTVSAVDIGMYLISK